MIILSYKEIQRPASKLARHEVKVHPDNCRIKGSLCEIDKEEGLWVYGMSINPYERISSNKDPTKTLASLMQAEKSASWIPDRDQGYTISCPPGLPLRQPGGGWRSAWPAVKLTTTEGEEYLALEAGPRNENFRNVISR